MFEKITIFIFTFIFTTSLNAYEPILAFLERIDSNEIQKFRLDKSSFFCRPYGIVTVDELYSNATFDSTCKKTINEFYIKHPMSKYYSHNILKVEQMYHIEFKKQKCIVFAKGEKSLSELLLENGLAFKKPHLKDKEYAYIFKKAQDNARYNKKGMWGNAMMRSCILEMYK